MWIATPTCPACLWPKHQPSGQTCARWEPFPGAEQLHCKDPTKIIMSIRLPRTTQDYPGLPRTGRIKISEYQHLSTTTYHGLQADALPKFLCFVHLMGRAISLSQWGWGNTCRWEHHQFHQILSTENYLGRTKSDGEPASYLLHTVLDKPFNFQNLSNNKSGNHWRSSVMTQSESFEIGPKLISVLSIWQHQPNTQNLTLINAE